jgi:hypothetical protein
LLARAASATGTTAAPLRAAAAIATPLIAVGALRTGVSIRLPAVSLRLVFWPCLPWLLLRAIVSIPALLLWRTTVLLALRMLRRLRSSLE